MTEWEDEPNTDVVNAILESDPPEAEKLARMKLHAIAKRPESGEMRAVRPPSKKP